MLNLWHGEKDMREYSAEMELKHENEMMRSIRALPWWRKGSDGWPIELVKGRPFGNFVRIVFQNIRKITG